MSKDKVSASPKNNRVVRVRPEVYEEIREAAHRLRISKVELVGRAWAAYRGRLRMGGKER